MKTKTISARTEAFLFLYDAHTKLFPNVIEGISDKDAHNRLNTKANHVAWLAGALVQQRFDNANALGSELKPASDEFFSGFKGIQDNITYPSLSSYLPDWEKITPVLRDLLIKITDEKLDSKFDFPDMPMSGFELIAWSTHREAYLIGQIGLWRRLMGYDAMKYPM